MLRFGGFFTFLTAVVAGCSSGGDPVGALGYDGAIASDDAAAPTSESGADVSRPVALTYLRIAQLSPDLGLIDFCVKPEGAEAIGPLLAGAEPGGGTFGGLAFAQMSGEVAIAALGTMQVIVVASPATGCSAARAVGTATFGAGKHVTLMISGVSKGSVEPSRGVLVTAFADDVMPSSAALRVRVVHGALGTALSPGYAAMGAALTSGNEITPLAAEVRPRNASTPSAVSPVVDALGYHVLTGLPAGEVGVRIVHANADGGASLWSSQTANWALANGDARTVFVVSPPAGGASDLVAVVCDDLRRSPAATCLIEGAF